MIALWGKVKAWLAMVGLALVAIAAAWARGRASGRAAAEREQERRGLEAMREAKEIDDEVAALNPADLDRRIDRWMRRE